MDPAERKETLHQKTSPSKTPRQSRPMWSQRISWYRSKRGWTQLELANLIGSDEKSVRRWEKGGSMPRLYSRQKLAEVFEVTQIELGFPQEVYPQQQDEPDNPTMVPEAPVVEGQEAEKEDNCDQSSEEAAPTGYRVTSKVPIWLQEHGWWFIVLALVVIGACTAWLFYLLVIKPYMHMQHIESQPSSFVIQTSELVQDTSDY